MKLLTVAASIAIAASLASTATSQRLSSSSPDVGSPGDMIVIEGDDLLSVSQIDFTAVVGGFAGIWTQPATPTFQTGNFIIVQVPSFGFTPPSATPPGDPNGFVGFTDSNGRRQRVPFYYLQGTWYGERGRELNPQTRTVGKATNQGGGGASISFDHRGGHPAPGNTITMKLVNTAPMQPAGLFIGTPTRSPIMFGDGVFVVDLFGPNILIPAITDGTGTATLLPLRVPQAARTEDLVFQWIMLNQAIPGGFACSNGLQSTMYRGRR